MRRNTRRSHGDLSLFVNHGANISVVLRHLRLLLALLLACLVISELFFFQNVKNFPPHQRERQFYCATGRFFERKPIIKRAIEAARWIEENALKFEELSNKADSLCKLVAENNSGSKETKSKKGNSKVHVPTSCAKPMGHFVSLCKNIYIYKICIFQLLSRVYKPLATLPWKLQNQVKELWQLKISMYKTRVVIHVSVLERHVRHRFTGA